MKNLASPAVIKEILAKSGFHFSKSLGQNFLIQESVLEDMIAGAQITEHTNVIEIGPGFGTLTQRLCMAAKKVVSIEIDSSVIPILQDNLSDFDNLHIINSDVLKLDLNQLIADEFDGGEVKIIANLPYYITTPIIMGILEKKVPVKSLVIMIQKEVADRIVASPSTKDYGALSVAVNFYSTPQILLSVPPSAFIPQPKVSSAVVQLCLRDKPPVEVNSAADYFKLVKAAFAQRRKTLLNALTNSGSVGKSKDEISAILTECGIDPKRRGETLSLEEFAKLEKVLF